MRLAVDTGGTFTDLVVERDDGCLHLFKSPTTPLRLVDGVLNVLALGAEGLGLPLPEFLSRAEVFVHGTTVATNAVITGHTAKTAFLTTRGHPDVLVLREGGRIGLPMFDFSIAFPKPYIPQALTFEVFERVGSDGKVIEPLDEQSVLNIVPRLENLEVEAVGVCLLWSIVNPRHELRVESLLRDHLPQVLVSLSHQVNPSLREYRRASSTCIDASLKPIMRRYLTELEQRLKQEGFGGRLLVVTSQGTVRDTAAVANAPVHSVKSGPAMAPVAGRAYSALDVRSDLAIVADTGGTTYDVALIRHGRIPETRETWLGRPHLGHMTGFPSIDIRSVGAGGGSIAWVDDGGLLHVGPESAGAQPGPVCYGQGGKRPTVTDAALVLGYIDPKFFLGGLMKLDADSARHAIERELSAPLGIAPEDSALAVMALLTETMAGAIEEITVHQGFDPRTAVMVGGGGAAGLNSVAIAYRIGCCSVVFPDTGAALSAVGGLLSRIGDDYTELCITSSDKFDRAAVIDATTRLRARCKGFAERAGDLGEMTIEFSVEARYAQQIWEIKLPLRIAPDDDRFDLQRLCEDFHRLHLEIFAFEDSGAEIEFINWRAQVLCDRDRAPIGSLVQSGAQKGFEIGERRAHFADAGTIPVPVYRFEALPRDTPLDGPAIVESQFTTIVIESYARFRRQESGSLVVGIT